MCLYTNINRESFNNFSLAEFIQSCCAAFSLYPKSKKDGFSCYCERSEAIQLKSRRVERSETPQDRTHNIAVGIRKWDVSVPSPREKGFCFSRYCERSEAIQFYDLLNHFVVLLLVMTRIISHFLKGGVNA